MRWACSDSHDFTPVSRDPLSHMSFVPRLCHASPPSSALPNCGRIVAALFLLLCTWPILSASSARRRARVGALVLPQSNVVTHDGSVPGTCSAVNHGRRHPTTTDIRQPRPDSRTSLSAGRPPCGPPGLLRRRGRLRPGSARPATAGRRRARSRCSSRWRRWRLRRRSFSRTALRRLSSVVCCRISHTRAPRDPRRSARA